MDMNRIVRHTVVAVLSWSLVPVPGAAVRAEAAEPLARVEMPAVAERLVDSAANRIADSLGVLEPFVCRLVALRQGGEGVVSVFHIGDSHVQAGFLTDTLRMFFQRDFGSAGRGLVAPLRLIGTNEPFGYRITSPNRWTGYRCTGASADCPVGVTAMALATDEPDARFTISARDSFSLVRAFHHPHAPLLLAPDSLAAGIACPCGDTEEMTAVVLDRPVTETALWAPVRDSLYDTPVFYGFSLENGRPGVLYHASGINGTTFEHLNRNGEELVRQSALLAPDLIVVSLGTNDSFGRNYNTEYVYRQIVSFVRSLQRVNPGVPLLLTAPMEFCKRQYSKGRYVRVVNPNGARTAALIGRAAAECGAAFWDFYRAAGGAGANGRWQQAGLVRRDRIHLSEEGYTLQARMLYNAFVDYYNRMVR